MEEKLREIIQQAEVDLRQAHKVYNNYEANYFAGRRSVAEELLKLFFPTATNEQSRKENG